VLLRFNSCKNLKAFLSKPENMKNLWELFGKDTEVLSCFDFVGIEEWTCPKK
jgi:hypothetical protein